MTYRILALFVLAGVVLGALYWHHQRQKLALRQEYAEFAGWRKLVIKMAQEVWECPRCAAPAYSWKAVERHNNPATSACAWLEEHQEAIEGLLARVAALAPDDDAPELDHYSRDDIPWTAVTEPGDDAPALEDARLAALDDPPGAAGRAQQWAAMGDLIERTTEA